jgi:ATP-dependent protease ClpP protease subunit
MFKGFLPLLVLLSACHTPVAFAAPSIKLEVKLTGYQMPDGMIDVLDVASSDLAPAQKKFDELVAGGDKVVMFRINSFGGSVFEGMQFIQHVEDAKRANGVHVMCVVDFKAMSMGFAFMQSFCDDRLMTKRSVLLAHNSSSGVKGNAIEQEEQLQISRALDAALAEVCAARLKMSVADYKAKIAFHAWTMAWEEAMAAGAVDNTIDQSMLPAPYKLDAPAGLNFSLRIQP